MVVVVVVAFSRGSTILIVKLSSREGVSACDEVNGDEVSMRARRNELADEEQEVACDRR